MNRTDIFENFNFYTDQNYIDLLCDSLERFKNDEVCSNYETEISELVQESGVARIFSEESTCNSNVTHLFHRPYCWTDKKNGVGQVIAN